MRWVKGWRNTNWQLQNSHGDVECSMGNIVNSTAITRRSARWVRDLWGDHFVGYIDVWPLCCVPATNIILNANGLIFFNF